MANNEDGEKNIPRGNEWEVVTLTASAYAAAPDPKEDELEEKKMSTDGVGEGEAETSRVLYMSGHFVFPPSEHENLPIEPDNSAIPKEQGGEDIPSDLESWDKGLSVQNEFPGMQILDEKGSGASIHGVEFEESLKLQGSSLVDDEQNRCGTSKHSSFISQADLSGSLTSDESIVVTGDIGPSYQNLRLSPDIPDDPEPEDKDDKYDAPSGAWWRRRAASLFNHAKEANAFWSIFIAAAVMGLVILGQRWQQEKWQTLQLRWRININDQKASRVWGPITRLKDVIVGGQRRGSFIRASSASES